MRNLKVSAKLLTAFAAVLVLTALVGAMGVYGLWRMNAAAAEMSDIGLASTVALAELRELFAVQRSDLRGLFLAQGDPERVRAIIAGIADSDRAAGEQFALYERLIQNTADEEGYFRAKEGWTGPFAAMKSAMWGQIDAGDFDGAYATFMGSGPDCITPISGGLADAARLCELSTQALAVGTDALYGTLLWALLGSLALAVLLGVALAFMLSRLIAGPLKPLVAFMTRAGGSGDLALSPEDLAVIGRYSAARDEIGQTIAAAALFVNRVIAVSEVLEHTAGGDLTASLEPLSPQDTLGLSLARMADNLSGMFGGIRASAAQVSTGAEQVADGSQALAAGSTEQAASVEELSGALSQVAGHARHNAETARRAAQLARDISGSADESDRRMGEMLASVQAIHDSSRDIGKVIKVIDDIAFQTNILALNAAVEAARAGQYGKGFAVVAEEVRNLAAKSAEAAKDTESLIAGSMSRAEQGVRIAGETSESLMAIRTGIGESSRLVGDIAAASEEQSAAIAGINAGIDQVAQVVQQNSATAEESAAAAQEMSSQSSMLREMIGQFKLRESARPALNTPPLRSLPGEGAGGDGTKYA